MEHLLSFSLSAVCPNSSEYRSVSDPPDLSSVLEGYHALPPMTVLQTSSFPAPPMPSSRLFNLSRPEQREAMEEYIRESIAGIICPFSSLWCSVLFC